MCFQFFELEDLETCSHFSRKGLPGYLQSITVFVTLPGALRNVQILLVASYIHGPSSRAVSSLHGLVSAFIYFQMRLYNPFSTLQLCTCPAVSIIYLATWCAGILFILVFFSQIGGSPLLSLALCALAGWRAMDFYMGEVAIDVKSSKKLDKETKKARLSLDLFEILWTFAILKLICWFISTNVVGQIIVS